MGYGIDPPNFSATRMAFLAALIDGDIETGYRVARRLLDEGIPFNALVADFVGPVQRDLGARWAEGDLSVADEHAATAVAEGLLTLLTGGFDAADGSLVVAACPEGDAHSMPARVVAAVLAMRGYRTVLLGGSLPAVDLGDYLVRQEPLALALSVSMSAALYRSAASVAIAHMHGVPVVIGGRALGHNKILALKLGVDAWAGSPDEGADVLDRWRLRPPKPMAAPIRVPDECAQIDLHRAALLAAAIPPDEAEASPDLVDDVGRLLDVLQGAILLDEPALLTGQLNMLRGIRNGAETSAGALERVLDRLVTATAGPLPASTAVLRAAMG